MFSFWKAMIFPLYKKLPLCFKEKLTVVTNQPGGIRRKFDNLHPRQLSFFRPLSSGALNETVLLPLTMPLSSISKNTKLIIQHTKIKRQSIFPILMNGYHLFYVICCIYVNKWHESRASFITYIAGFFSYM